MTLDAERRCIACGANLTGPFQPEVTLSRPAETESAGKVRITAQPWICPGCGLVHWYAPDEGLDKLMDALPEDEEAPVKPGSNYERRSQMMRMLRRVRRM